MNIKNLFRDIRNRKIKIVFAFIDKETLGLYATLSDGKHILIINLDLLIVDTFIHELCHHNHPTFSESKVYKLTTRKVNRLSMKEIKEISKLVMKFHS